MTRKDIQLHSKHYIKNSIPPLSIFLVLSCIYSSKLRPASCTVMRLWQRPCRRRSRCDRLIGSGRHSSGVGRRGGWRYCLPRISIQIIGNIVKEISKSSLIPLSKLTDLVLAIFSAYTSRTGPGPMQRKPYEWK